MKPSQALRSLTSLKSPTADVVPQCHSVDQLTAVTQF